MSQLNNLYFLLCVTIFCFIAQIESMCIPVEEIFNDRDKAEEAFVNHRTCVSRGHYYDILCKKLKNKGRYNVCKKVFSDTYRAGRITFDLSSQVGKCETKAVVLRSAITSPNLETKYLIKVVECPQLLLFYNRSVPMRITKYYVGQGLSDDSVFTFSSLTKDEGPTVKKGDLTVLDHFKEVIFPIVPPKRFRVIFWN